MKCTSYRIGYLMISLLLINMNIFAQANAWINYTIQNSGVPGNNCKFITVDNQNTVWVGTGMGLGKFDGTNWTTYSTSNSPIGSNYIMYFTIDASGNRWIGTLPMGSVGGGLVKWDGGSNWTVFNSTNSTISNNDVRAIVSDNSGNLWVGTYGAGIHKFNGTTWTAYNTSNSQLPNNDVITLAAQGNTIWIGTYGGGLTKFDGTTWTTYKTANSSIPSNNVQSIAIDAQGNKWIGCFVGGFAKFDGTNWTVYTMQNSTIPSYNVMSVTIDAAGNKWIATLPYLNSSFTYVGGGIAKFDGTNWTVYNEENSGLPDNWTYSIKTDTRGNKWIGTEYTGVSVFNENGVVVPVELVSFTGLLRDGAVSLQWSTATELNNKGFEVQRKSADANYSTIHFVNGAGTTTDPRSYSFNDKNVKDGKYFYRLKQVDVNGTYAYSPEIEVNVKLLASGDKGSNPGRYELFQNYPNPFNPATKIEYSVKEDGFVSLEVYNILGNKIATLVNNKVNAGTHRVTFNASGLPTGIYIYKLETGGFKQIRKMAYLK